MRLFFSALVVAAVVVVDVMADGQQIPESPPRAGALTSHGCFTSEGDLQDPMNELQYDLTYISSGFCHQNVCKQLNATVLAIKGTSCYCGNAYPPADAKVDDAECNFPCVGWPQEACGTLGEKGKARYSVFNTGVVVDVPSSGDKPSASGSSAAPTATESDTETKKSSGPNAGAIAGGVICAIVVIGCIAGGAVFYMRRKRNKEIEEEHRRNAAINNFVGDKSPSMTDSRVDPSLANQRLSNGSLADDKDYSRRILRVMNA